MYIYIYIYIYVYLPEYSSSNFMARVGYNKNEAALNLLMRISI